MKNERIVQYLASDAVQWKKDKYALQQQVSVVAANVSLLQKSNLVVSLFGNSFTRQHSILQIKPTIFLLEDVFNFYIIVYLETFNFCCLQQSQSY